MKKLKARNLLLIGLISTGLIGFENTSFAFGKKDKEVVSIENNQLKNRKEYKDIKRSLANIENDKIRIAFYKSELKDNREEGLAIESNISKKELRKAKADLRRNKKYLRIDRADLRCDQRVAIKEAKKEERLAKKELRLAKVELHKDVMFQNSDELTADAKAIQAWEAKVKKEKNETAAIKQETSQFFEFLDAEIEERA